VTCSEILTGVVPYTDLRAEAQAHTVLEMNYTEQQLTAAVVAEGLRPKLTELETGAPLNLLKLISKCWDSDPLLRLSMDDVVKELKTIMLICKKEASINNHSCSFNDTNDIFDKEVGLHDKSVNLRSFQEDLNWYSQGERKSNITDHVTSQKYEMWPQSLHEHPIYKPKLAFGSFATCGRRESMEDTHFLLPEFCKEKDIHIFGIFDGHRGAAAAEFSARALPAFLQMSGSTKGPKQALTEAFLKTDVAFREELAFQNNAKRILQKNWHPGCTAVAALIVGSILFVGNAGDCRAILCRSGHPCSLTKDHVASDPAERARIMNEGIEVKWQVDTWRVGAAALQVTRSIGDDDLKPAVTAEPEISETLLSSEDEYLVMASDGLWDVLSNEDVISIIRDTVKDPGMCSKRLASEAAERGSKDNISVIIVFLRPVSTAERKIGRAHV